MATIDAQSPTQKANDGGSSEGDWILVEEGNLKGVTLVVNRVTGDTVSMSTRTCRDGDRWEKLPDLSGYPALEVLDLHKSRYLTDFDASACPPLKLQKLYLTRCDNLCTISPSVGALHNLVELNLFDSPKISHLPDEIGNLKRLKKLSFGCSNGVANKNLKVLPETLGQLENLEELILDECKSLEALPETIGGLKKLTHLSMKSCKRITELPESIGGCTRLVDVSFSKCIALKSLPESIENWVELEDLIVLKCKSITKLPEGIGKCKKLSNLNLRSCVKLTSLPTSLEGLPNLRTLDIAMCDSLKMVPTWLVGVEWRMDPLDLTQRVKRRRAEESGVDSNKKADAVAMEE